MVSTTQLSLVIGSPMVAVILTSVDMHLRTNRLIAKIDRMCEKPFGTQSFFVDSFRSTGSPETGYQCQVENLRRQWEEERLIFEERIRQTYLLRDSK